MKINKIVITSALIGGMFSGQTMAETLKVSTFLPPMHTFVRAVATWGEELKEKSGGELELEMFPAAQLAPPPRQFDLVRSGGADIAIFLHAMTPGRFAMTELANLPLSYPSAGQESALSSRRLTELAPEFLAAEHAGTRILWMAVTPPLKMHFTDTDPSDLGNIAGKRMRYAGSTWQQIVEVLGASPVPVPPAETADAMGKGVVDGATFPFEAAQAFDLGPVTKYSLEPGLASATFAVVISDAAYERLSPEMQTLINDSTGPDRAEWYGALWDASEAKGRAHLAAAGTEIVSLSDGQLETLQSSFKGIIDASSARAGDQAAAFLEAYTE